MSGRVLIVDDDQSMCEMLVAGLHRRGFESQSSTSGEEAFSLVKEQPFDIVLTDLNMPGLNGIDLCERIVANRSDVPVVVITAFGSLDTAIAAIRAGAYDFVTKPVEMDMLALTLGRAVKHRELQEQVKVLSDAAGKSERLGQLIGESPTMQALYDEMRRLAETDVTVLITGESGTGKELVANALHRRSHRRLRPFLAINCSALPETLLESEFFGHKRGAFTDAHSDRAGLCVQADCGTLFLDEIGDLPLALQPKLLRALEERLVRPVGADKEISFDVRLIAATNRDLERAIEQDRFREDLFFRINVVQLEVPPLRSRGTDVLLLAQNFLEQSAARFDKPVVGLSKAVGEKLLNYDWPGNVRELRNAIERATALTRYDRLAVEDLPEKIRSYRTSRLVLGGDNPQELGPMEDVEKRYVLHVLKSVGGNRSRAARILGFDRKTLYRKLLGYGVAEDKVT